MAFPTAVNDAKSTRLITTPISEAEVNEAFQKVQSRSTSGNPITNDVLGAFVQYVSVQFAGNADPDAMANQILNYLQPYDGANKKCFFLLCGYTTVNWTAPSVTVGYQAGTLPGVNKDWAIVCAVTWD
jgi:hypothetical protein